MTSSHLFSSTLGTRRDARYSQESYRNKEGLLSKRQTGSLLIKKKSYKFYKDKALQSRRATASLLIKGNQFMKEIRKFVVVVLVQRNRHVMRFCLREQGSIFPAERDHWWHLGMCAMEEDMSTVVHPEDHHQPHKSHSLGKSCDSKLLFRSEGCEYGV
eukprot:1157138-Pelagomonas_calceolata.AAC.4